MDNTSPHLLHKKVTWGKVHQFVRRPTGEHAVQLTAAMLETWKRNMGAVYGECSQLQLGFPALE